MNREEPGRVMHPRRYAEQHRSGFSLVQVMLAMGVATIGMLAITSMTTVGFKAQKGLENAFQLAQFGTTLQQILLNRSPCEANLVNILTFDPTDTTNLQPAANALQIYYPKAGPGGTVIRGDLFVDKSVTYGGWNVKSLGIQVVGPAGPNAYMINVVVNFEKKKDASGNVISLGSSTGQRQATTLIVTTQAAGSTVKVTGCGTTSSHGSQTFTSNQNFIVPVNVTKVRVRMVGGGGGGAGVCGSIGGGGGGGAGGYCEGVYDVTPGASIPITVGAGGAGGQGVPSGCTGSTNGQPGGQSSFGAYCSATGGAGGLSSPAWAGGSPGRGQIGAAPGAALQTLFDLHGGWGSDGCPAITNPSVCGGNGGASYFGGGGRAGTFMGLGSANGIAPGSGGGGSYQFTVGYSNQGGRGAPGLVVVEWGAF